jgi:YggT family protein
MLTRRKDIVEPVRTPYLGTKKQEETHMQPVIDVVIYLLGIARLFIFAHFIMSWLISFQVLNIRQPFVNQVWYTLNRILDPIYRPIRNILPNMGGIDLSPLVALIGIQVVVIFLSGL